MTSTVELRLLEGVRRIYKTPTGLEMTEMLRDRRRKVSLFNVSIANTVVKTTKGAEFLVTDSHGLSMVNGKFENCKKKH